MTSQPRIDTNTHEFKSPRQRASRRWVTRHCCTWRSRFRLLISVRRSKFTPPTAKNGYGVMNKIDFAVGIGGENGQGIASTGNILALIFARRGLHLNAYNAYQSI